jgi:hypothetical protein
LIPQARDQSLPFFLSIARRSPNQTNQGDFVGFAGRELGGGSNRIKPIKAI